MSPRRFPLRAPTGRELVLLALLLAGLVYRAWPEARLADGARAERVLVSKSERRLRLLSGDGEVLATYAVALGREPAGDKVRRGDGRTPEGTFVISSRTRHSRYHGVLSIGPVEPSKAPPAEHARLEGIAIDGIKEPLGWLGRLHRWVDWTEGCIAVTDSELDGIWSAVDDGVVVEIRP